MKGNQTNKPSLFEKKRATPLDLTGEWYVELIEILYFHNLTNLDKSYTYLLLSQHIDEKEFKFVQDVEKDQQRLNFIMINRSGATYFVNQWNVFVDQISY